MAQRRSSSSRTPNPRPTASMAAPQNPGKSAAGQPPPLKKRKYVPGGPGGGGRYIEVDVTETPPPAKPKPKPKPSSGRKNTTPRARPKPRPNRETTTNSTPSHLAQPLPPQSAQQDSTLAPATPANASRPKRQKTNNNRRFTSSAAAALAASQGDGYKPREERGWEEFHPKLDIDASLAVFSAKEVDGVVANNSIEGGVDGKNAIGESEEGEDVVEGKRRLGRPRGSSCMLSGISTPDGPKAVPPPGPNPREKLTLPKPSFAIKDPFLPFEQKGVGQQNYVDRTMANVGYQESDLFLRLERGLIRMPEPAEEDLDVDPPAGNNGTSEPTNSGVGVGRVEYDMDEQDAKWLETYNAQRKIEQVEPIKPAIFEITMTKIEKEWHALEKRIPKPNPKPPQTQRPRSSSAAAVNGEHPEGGEEQDSKCAICDDGECENANAIVFCDGCDLAVHQECYGVPYIPEGQWLCRKCQLIGRGQPSCIFCPNTEGAFKQTNTSKWAHVLCAVWIPEVSMGNPALMEPVSEVEKVPRNRWKLVCYICRQKMGACIQCSNKNCFVAFHVTCGRRAQLYLKMKLVPGAPAVTDSNGLKAYCDKHVSPEWQEQYDTESATAEAMQYYRSTMQGRRWGDSQAAALALGPESQEITDPPIDSNPPIAPRITLTVGGNKRKRPAVPKTIWKLPSGAPVIPQVLLEKVAASLQRFTVRQRKQYAEDACKYWTLKREARRGAALLKRLQLQLETFSSMEMTRRNFAGMGVAGNVRLRRRIEFADRLFLDVDKARMLCDEVKKREREKLKDAETLRHIVDVVYFPVPPLLWPIFERALALDGRGVFRAGLQFIRSKLDDRSYTSVSEFSRDLANVFTSEIGVASVGDTAELQEQISGRAPELTLEQREKRTLAKRIIKAIQPALEDALKKESELSGKPFEKELKDLDVILEHSVLSRRNSFEEEVTNGDGKGVAPASVNPVDDNYGQEQSTVPQKEAADAEEAAVDDEAPDSQKQMNGGTPTQYDEAAIGNDAKSSTSDQEGGQVGLTAQAHEGEPAEVEATQANGVNNTDTDGNATSDPGKPQVSPARRAPLTPPDSDSSQKEQQLALAQAGIQWYMQPFDPVGTTVHEERWMGRDVMRGMSEELSEMDEDEMRDLRDVVGDCVVDGAPGRADKGAAETGTAVETAPAAPSAARSRPKTRRRWRGFK